MNTTFKNNNKTPSVVYWLIGVASVSLLFVGVEVVRSSTAEQTESYDPLLSSRIIIDHEQSGDEVKYTYLGDPLPETLTEGELVHLRTDSSYSRLVVLNDDTATVETISYPWKTFVRDALGAWHYVEHDTTTFDQFLKTSALRTIGYAVSNAILSVAYAITDTIYSVAGGDGYISGVGSASALNATTCRNNAFSGAHSAITGTVSSSATTFSVLVEVTGAFDDLENIWSCDATIDRGFLPFDTSSISSGASISSATLNVYVTAKNNGSNDGSDYITVIETSQATHSSLASGDFDNVGTTEGVDAGQRKDITSISTSAYLVFTLNATGLGFINISGVDAPCSTTNGISCIGLREGHDFSGTSVTLNTSSSVTFSSADATGTTQDPYLSITYTVSAEEVQKHDVFWFD